MISKVDIITTWALVRKNNHSIPDEVLDFMKAASLQKLSNDQPPIQKGEDYWKKRCESAEKLINIPDDMIYYLGDINDYQAWQQLKNNPTP